ncbi:MAG TPA: addiction module toxin RelE [Nitrospirae bacterium]|nr:transposase IS200 like protein [bacterium BMS3Abin06]HDH13294.1 addiction module toxin RelE [Nitrospirota bacterium]HDZ00634.1 addiction module toxin RelE [Nitrospirota bacterium]
MARPLRIEYEGAVYHITSRGNAGEGIFRDEEDRKNMLATIKKVRDRYKWLCHAYCLMDNHYHLIIETPEGNLSEGMRQLNGVYTQMFNKKHKRAGHIFQGRYKAILIQKESHLLEVCRYVVLNPVRAGIVRKPDEWKWSSYRGTAGQRKPHPCLTADWVLGQFGKRKRQAQKKYKEFVRAGIGGERIWKEVRGQSILGKEDFAESLIEYVKGYGDIKEIPRSQRYASRPGLDELFDEETKGDRKKRKKKVQEAVERHGYRQKEVADYIGIHYSVISKLLKG